MIIINLFILINIFLDFRRCHSKSTNTLRKYPANRKLYMQLMETIGGNSFLITKTYYGHLMSIHYKSNK